MSHPPAPPHPLAMRLFGPFDVRVQGTPVAHWHTRKCQWLLALLTLRHDRPVERSWLAGTLWPESTQSQAAANLRLSLTHLRHSLGAESYRLHASSAHTLGLELSGAEVDLLGFDAAMAQGDLVSLEAAVGLYRGPLLEGCSEEWVMPEQQAREQAYLSALEQLAQAALGRGDTARASALMVEGLPLSREVGEPWTLAVSLCAVGWLALGQGDYERATALFEESVTFGRLAKDDLSISFVLYFLAGLTFLRGDLAVTRSHAEEGLTLARKTGFHHGIAHALEMLGRVQVAEGDLAEARPLLATSLRMLQERGRTQCCAHNLEGFAYLALAEARAQRAARLLGAAEAVLTSSKTFLLTTERVRQDRTLAAVRAALSEEAFTAAWAEGGALSLEQAVEYALEE